MNAKGIIQGVRFARKILPVLAEDLGLPTDKVSLKIVSNGGSQAVRASTEYGYRYRVELDFNQTRDLRDVLFILAHELRHIWQFINGVNLGSKEARAATKGKPVLYRGMQDEKDADEYALMMERSYKYTNTRINPDAHSLYIHVKIARHTLGF